MCSGRSFAAWEAECIRNLMAVEGCELALLLIDDRPPPPAPGRMARLRELFDPKSFLWRLYQRLSLNRASLSTRTIDLSAELGSVPELRCQPSQHGKFVQRFRLEEVAEVRNHELDFVMRFAFNILRGEILDAARYGIWSFHHGDPDLYRGTPPGFWEIYRGDPVTGTVLQRLTERLDAGVMLHKGFFKTDFGSYARNRDTIFFGAADWPARLCRQIQAGLVDKFAAEASSTDAPLYRAPSSLQMIGFLGKTVWAWLANQWKALFRVQQWSVGIVDAPIAKVAGLVGSCDVAELVSGARWLAEPAGRFLADPFAVPSDRGLTVLVEDYDWASELGQISALAVADDGSVGPMRHAISLPSHLSYPFLLEVDGDLYCVPESSAAGDLVLYKASDDLKVWNQFAILISGTPIIDATIVRYQEKWWLFGTRADAGDNSKLFGWHADELEGPWTPHLANPLKTDVRSSRPAGRPFIHECQLYRPAQNCSESYGQAVAINRVTTLTLDDFEEETVSIVTPDAAGKYPTGLHTLCGAGDRTIIDGSRSMFMASHAARTVRRKVNRLFQR